MTPNIPRDPEEVMAHRIHKVWTYDDFLAICRAIDDGHRASNRGEPSGGLQAQGGLVTLLERHASMADLQEVGKQLGCNFNPRSVAFAIRDEADARMQPPSTVLVDLLNLTIT